MGKGDEVGSMHRARPSCAESDMKQQTLAVAADQNAQYEQYSKPTRRDIFLATMEEVVPWAELCGVIESHYPKPCNGRPPAGLERMLRMYFVQQ